MDVLLPAPLEIHPVQQTDEPFCLTSQRLKSKVLQVVAKLPVFCLPSMLELDRAFSPQTTSVPELIGLPEPEQEGGSLALTSFTFSWIR